MSYIKYANINTTYVWSWTVSLFFDTSHTSKIILVPSFFYNFLSKYIVFIYIVLYLFFQRSLVNILKIYCRIFYRKIYFPHIKTGKNRKPVLGVRSQTFILLKSSRGWQMKKKQDIIYTNNIFMAVQSFSLKHLYLNQNLLH